MPGRLAGKVAVITGGASGIGLASLRLFAREGADLVVVDRDVANLPDADREGAGRPPLLLEGDVGDEAAVERHADAVAERFGGFDILLACAGWSSRTSVPDTTLSQWEGVLNTNLTGSFLWSRAAIRSMRERGGGSIILIASQLAFAGGRNNAAYLAAKGGIASLARTMGRRPRTGGDPRQRDRPPAPSGPPLLESGFARADDPVAARAWSVSRHPLGRLGEAEEVANAALFLASDESSFTTGFVPDGRRRLACRLSAPRPSLLGGSRCPRRTPSPESPCRPSSRPCGARVSGTPFYTARGPSTPKRSGSWDGRSRSGPSRYARISRKRRRAASAPQPPGRGGGPGRRGRRARRRHGG